jgi:hypothetical protein
VNPVAIEANTAIGKTELLLMNIKLKTSLTQLLVTGVLSNISIKTVSITINADWIACGTLPIPL